MPQAQDVANTLGLTPSVSDLGSASLAYQRIQRSEDTNPELLKARAEQTSALDKQTKESPEIVSKIEGMDLGINDKWDAEKEMQQFSTPTIKQFGSAGAVFSILASAFTHQPMVNALSGAAAAMKAIQAGNADAYQKAYEAWKTNTDEALRRNQLQLEQYRAALESLKDAPAAAEAKVRELQGKFDDQKMAVLSEAGLTEKREDLLLKRESVGIQAAEAKAHIEEIHSKLVPYEIYQEGVKAAVKANGGKDLSPQQKAKVWSDSNQMFGASTLTPETLMRMAGQYLDGDKSVVYGLGYGGSASANKAMFQNYVTMVAQQRGMDDKAIALKQAEFVGLQSGERMLGTQQARIGMAVDELDRLLPVTLAASNAVARSSLVPWTEVQQAIQKGTSDPKLARLTAATNTIINVYARAVNPVGVARVSDKEHAREMLSQAMGPEAYASVLDQLRIEAETANLAPGDVKEQFGQVSGLGQRKSSKDDIYEPANQADYEALPPGAQYRMPGDPLDHVRVKQ